MNIKTDVKTEEVAKQHVLIIHLISTCLQIERILASRISNIAFRFRETLKSKNF